MRGHLEKLAIGSNVLTGSSSNVILEGSFQSPRKIVRNGMEFDERVKSSGFGWLVC